MMDDMKCIRIHSDFVVLQMDAFPEITENKQFPPYNQKIFLF